MQTVIAFLRLIIEFWSKELGLKKSLLHKWLPGKIKLFLVETLIEYRKKGGKIQDYAEAVGKNPATLYRWLRLYEEGKSLENHQPPGRPKKIYPRWIKKRIMKLHKKYPEASNRALALRFNNINSSVMLKANDIDNIIIVDEFFSLTSLTISPISSINYLPNRGLFRHWFFCSHGGEKAYSLIKKRGEMSGAE